MATAVKMDEETKSKLEELQAEIKLKTGKKVTQQDVLARLVESVSESRSEFIGGAGAIPRRSRRGYAPSLWESLPIQTLALSFPQ